ncbi:MAG: NUDIX domain-containing protein [Hamadaea sp.]|nr:NUDIX domain-containing protein [Hamadaea sp.]
MSHEVQARAAGRVLLLDALAEGETYAEAAARELREETGLALTAADLRGPVWTEVSEFSFNGVHYRQQQEFYVARVDRWEPNSPRFCGPS